MKRIILTVIGLSMLANSAFADPNDCIGQIGDVKQSLLKPNKFRATHGKCWRLMNGDPIKDTPLGKEVEDLNGILPDARGMFLRGMNHDGGGVDPDKNRKVGSDQFDKLKKHEHNFWTQTIHGGSAESAEIPRIRYSKKKIIMGTGFTAAQHDYTTSPGYDPGSPNHNTLNPGIDPEGLETNPFETRPKNISVYIYVHTGEIIK